MKLVVLILSILFFVSCKKDKDVFVPDPIQSILIPSSMRGFINQPESFWVFKRNDGRIDTARLTSIDSSIVRFNNYSPSDFIDVKICEMKYDFAFPFHQKFIIKSSLISDSYDKWGMPYGNLRYVAKSVYVEIGDTICGFDNCISLIQYFDSLEVEGVFYYDVIKFQTDEDIKLWWDAKIGLIQYEENNTNWKLTNYHLIK